MLSRDSVQLLLALKSHSKQSLEGSANTTSFFSLSLSLSLSLSRTMPANCIVIYIDNKSLQFFPSNNLSKLENGYILYYFKRMLSAVSLVFGVWRCLFRIDLYFYTRERMFFHVHTDKYTYIHRGVGASADHSKGLDTHTHSQSCLSSGPHQSQRGGVQVGQGEAMVGVGGVR